VSGEAAEDAQQLESMIAERYIARQLVRFARAMDERDWAALRDIMFDNATSMRAR
jgi:hypothetical protein